jgi:uncharacterized protein YndB with AHSA1/START domain
MPTIADPVVRTIDIDATPETVFEFFVDADKLNRWLTVGATLDPRPGGVCIQEHRGDDGQAGPFHMHGTFLDVDPHRRVVFTWGFTDTEIALPAGSTIVEVTFEPLGSGATTRVTLVHRDLPEDQVDEHATGWTEMLGRLAQAVDAAMTAGGGSA